MLEVRREAALVAHAGGKPALLEHRLERVVGLGAPAHRLGEGRRANRGDHELLHVHVGVRVRAAVENVHHRHGKHVRVRAAKVAEKLQASGVRRRPRHGHRHADDRVGAEPRLARRPVKVDQRLVNEPLVVGLVAEQFILDLLGHGVDGLGDPLAAVLGAAVAKLDGLERAGGRAARHAGPAKRAVVEYDLDFKRWVAPRVQNLPGMHRFNGRHVGSSLVLRALGSGMEPNGGMAGRRTWHADGRQPRRSGRRRRRVAPGRQQSRRETAGIWQGSPIAPYFSVRKPVE